MRKLKLSFPNAADKQYFLMFIFNKDGLKMESLSCEDQRRVIGAFSFQNVVGKDPSGGRSFSISKIHNKDRATKVVRDHNGEKVPSVSIIFTIFEVLAQKFLEVLLGVNFALSLCIVRGCNGQGTAKLFLSHPINHPHKFADNQSPHVCPQRLSVFFTYVCIKYQVDTVKRTISVAHRGTN